MANQESRPFYLTTAIDYTNAPPHLGHAYEKIAADAIARYQRLRGREVFFLTGVDEHGLKIERKAAELGVSPQAFVDEIAGRFKATWDRLGVAYDHFIRTTDASHQQAVQQVFARLMSQGDIVKANYEGLYCTGCEEFKNERDLVEGHCPQHGTAPQPYAQENYVFLLSRYKARLLKHVEAHPTFIAPETRKAEILNLIETFPDVSVSRQNLAWAIPVPGDPGQGIYVWVDALLNYLTGIGYGHDPVRFERYWPASLHLVGKDITKFHCIIWPALLLALDLPLPAQVYGHGWVNVGDQKMSKSLGNVVEPNELAERYGADALRYYLLREIAFGRDGSFTQEAFKKRVNADLANNLGNSLNRSLGMVEKHFEGRVPPELPAISAELREKLEETLALVERAMEAHAMQEALEAIWAQIDAVNKFIDVQAPWALAKAGELEKLGGVLYAVLETLRQISILVAPFIPTIAEKLWAQIGVDAPLADQRWAELSWGRLATGTPVKKIGPVFLRIEDEIASTGGKKK